MAEVHADIESYERLFREPVIRVRLDWEALRSARPRVVELAPSAVDVLAWYAPWYADSDGHEARWDANGARPLTFGTVRDGLGISADRRATIERMAEGFAAAPSPLLVPTYRIGAVQLVLDGNHRLAAALCLDAEPRLLAWSVEGPMDPAVLPDLTHWSR
jgi:hypothetical protein